MAQRTRLEITGWTRALNQRLEAQAKKLGLTKAALARSILHQALPLFQSNLSSSTRENLKQEEVSLE